MIQVQFQVENLRKIYKAIYLRQVFEVILWCCENVDCFTNAIEEEAPHKSYRRKRALLDNGRLDDDDELVVFSKLVGPIPSNMACNDCGSRRLPILSINRFPWDDPPGNAGDDAWCETIEHAVAVYKQNGWWPNLQGSLY